IPAARASWLAFPATKAPNVNVGLRLPGSTRRPANGSGAAAGVDRAPAETASAAGDAGGASATPAGIGAGPLPGVAAALAAGGVASATENSTAIASPVA